MFSHLTLLSRKRRSVREYANQPVDSEVLKDILEAGLRAPTSKNSRSTRFFVVEDKQLLKDFSECRERGSQFLSGAPVAIVVCSDSNKSKRPYSDCAIAASFIQLAVTDHDLGSCWCHIEDSPSPKGATAEEYIKYKLDLPDSYKVLCIIGIGEVAKADMLKPREREVEWERLFVGRYEEREL